MTASGPIDAAIGQRVRELRIERHMSQERFGELVGVTFQQIQKYEKGKDRVSVSTMLKMSQALGVLPSSICDIDMASEEGD
ncbi:hypothetical protein K32_44370 [Kaistia sp. 32K]|uniref:helix-turn-helix domain-containing protein n=1 Tax=Kaistia sp. 32K TaxID=2795690 RepID=UPI001915AF8A|nr:hypothetical protein K32_44370 [Kaistia sp. 32K]